LRRTGTEPRREDQDDAELQGKSGRRSAHRWDNWRASHHCPKYHYLKYHRFKTSDVSHWPPPSAAQQRSHGITAAAGIKFWPVTPKYAAIMSFRRVVRKASMVGGIV
jgi:hypothetical protein